MSRKADLIHNAIEFSKQNLEKGPSVSSSDQSLMEITPLPNLANERTNQDGSIRTTRTTDGVQYYTNKDSNGNVTSMGLWQDRFNVRVI
jgi:hypothetical protein